jgi:hypothetical protein
MFETLFARAWTDASATKKTAPARGSPGPSSADQVLGAAQHKFKTREPFGSFQPWKRPQRRERGHGEPASTGDVLPAPHRPSVWSATGQTVPVEALVSEASGQIIVALTPPSLNQFFTRALVFCRPWKRKTSSNRPFGAASSAGQWSVQSELCSTRETVGRFSCSSATAACSPGVRNGP